jgi:hypothetical protein
VFAGLGGFQFFDAAGTPITTDHFTLVSVDLPEPSSFGLLGVGLMFLLVLPMRSRFSSES